MERKQQPKIEKELFQVNKEFRRDFEYFIASKHIGYICLMMLIYSSIVLDIIMIFLFLSCYLYSLYIKHLLKQKIT